jgi:hypothetical protein
MEDGSCPRPVAVVVGDDLRTAACVFWKEARELRWVCKQGQGRADGECARPAAQARLAIGGVDLPGDSTATGTGGQ